MLLALDVESVDLLAEGAGFGAAGAYERVIATAHGEIDPQDPANRGIANLNKAPRNGRGLVEYDTDVYILRPKDPGLGNGRILYEVNNRGRKMLFGTIADGPQGVNDPRTLADVGNGLPLRMGYTIVWSGWDPEAPRANHGLAMRTPVATEDGKAIVREIRDEFVSGTRLGILENFTLSYDAAGLDPMSARLTQRLRAADRPKEIPRDRWTFIDGKTVRLLNEKPRPGVLYEFTYQAKNPKVLGLGFAATRDLLSWLRYDSAALKVTGRPVTHVLAIGISQSARYLRDYIAQGFNRGENGRRVFDGVLAHIGGIGRLFFNAPFGQPARTNTQHEDHDFPENAFPFSTATMTDPLTGVTGALFRGDGFDPRLIETNTSTEYWQKGASLLHTDPLGTRDVMLPDNARVYMIAGTQHAGRAGATLDPGPNANPRNPHNPMPAVRALLVALDEWVVLGRAPPASRTPSLQNGTLVATDRTGFPAIPNATIMGITNTVSPPGDWVHPTPAAHTYRVLVCRVDADGNEVAGIRLPDIAVPLATYTGWNAYKTPYPEGELADRDGSYLAFAPDKAAREATGDPRLSISERYANRGEYVAKVQAAAAALVRERLLLQEDADRYAERARSDTRLPPE
jgi:Alpha/beta hydrolase domain